MIIFNTTYLVHPQLEQKFLTWMKQTYIPQVKEVGLLQNPRLFKVLTDEKEGISFSLQWEAETVACMGQFGKNHQSQLEALVSKTFGESVLFFSTHLKEYDL